MNIGRGLVVLWVLFYYGLLYRAPRAVRLRLALERLGPIFVKFGQVLSTRSDLLAPDIADELILLQDRVAPFPGEQAVVMIEKALGQPIDSVFSSFELQPTASASIAQVHFAVLRSNNEAVAVKVLRPRIEKAIDKDLRWMRWGATWMERLSKQAKRLKPRAVVAEFDGYLHDELDLVREAANACALKRNMEALNMVQIPSIYWDYCRSNVLVMERMNGVPIRDHATLRAAGIDLPKLARDGIIIFYTQVFRDGFFHADMHPGNIQVSTQAETFGQYISLDFGIVGTLSDFDKEYLAQNFAAFFNRDYKGVARLHIESGWVAADANAEALESAIRTVCEPFFNRPLHEVSLGLILMRLFQVSRRFRVEIQPQLVLLQKTLLNMEGLGRTLDPNLDLWSVSKPFLEKWMREELGLKRLWRDLKAHTPQYIQMLPKLPLLVNHVLQQQEKAPEHLLAIAQLQKKTNRLGWLLGFALLVILVLAAVLFFQSPLWV